MNNNFIKKYKFYILLIVVVLFVTLIVNLPSLAKYKNANAIHTVSSWDGSIATNYQKGNGSVENPFVISNGAEFAFFVEQLKTTDYKDIYFEISNDIVLNPGIFSYNETDGLMYTLENITYYIKENSNEYYDNKEKNGNPIGTINTISMIENFKGNINGQKFTIFGLFMNNTINNGLAVFKNLSGSLSNLNITNSMVFGKEKVAGIAINSESSKLENVIYDGYVINKSQSKIIENEIEDVVVLSNNIETITNIPLPINDIEGVIKTIKLKGKYLSDNVDGTNTIKINGVDITSNNEFEINLGTNFGSEVNIETLSTVENTNITFSNLLCEIEYIDDIASGIIANSKNTIIKNTINKADIYGNYIASGIIAKENGSLDLIQSYNKGNVKSNAIASGILSVVKNNENNINIKNVYNTGVIIAPTSASIVSIFENNTGNINIQSTINAIDNYFINSIINTTVNVTNSYMTSQLSIYNGIINGQITPTTVENLYNIETLKEISYNEYINEEEIQKDNSKVWIFKNNKLPELYIENLTTPLANINVNSYSWNKYSTELKTIEVKDNIIFEIQPTSMINPIDSYYCIVNSKVVIPEENLTTLNWVEYKEAINIETSGYYVIYAKIVDLDGNITYMNTDVIKFDKLGFKTEIKYNNLVWSNFRTHLETMYTNKDINLTINAQGDLVSINSIEYYISEKKLTEEEVKNIQQWNIYSNNILINNVGTYIVYAKILDNEGNIIYLNTDYLEYNGFKETIGFGSGNKQYDTNYITSNSSIKLTFEGNFAIDYQKGYSHNLISNALLPFGTEITIFDKKNNKVYRKIIDTEEDLYGYNESCSGKINCSKYATYSFELFKEIGSINNNYYDETKNEGKTIENEKFIVTIDFKNTNLIDNYYDLSFSLVIKDLNNNYLYQTLDNTISSINIYSSLENTDVLSSHNLLSDYTNQVLKYNNNSELNINFSNQITYNTINNKNIIDTQYENKKAGLLIKLYNEENEEVNKTYLDNMIFQVGGRDFFATIDNSIKINLGSILNSKVMTLKIKTKPNSSGLETGNYYIKINKFLSENGYDYDTLYEEEIIIPIVVENQEITIPEHSFDVQMDSLSVMLNKKEINHKVNFNLIYEGSFFEPKLRVSLYEKKNIGAIDQEYVLVDLAEYVSNPSLLESVETNKYFVDFKNPTLELDILPKKFNYNGYKYVFELYDGTTKIGKIDKYFIVR